MKTDKQQVSVLFMLFSILFCVCLITANVLETKQISIGPVNITGGLLVFPVSYIINDCVCEVWGFRKARLLIWALRHELHLRAVRSAGRRHSWRALLAQRRGLPCRVRPCPAHCRRLVCGLPCRLVHHAYVMSRMKISSNGKHFSLRAW